MLRGLVSAAIAANVLSLLVVSPVSAHAELVAARPGPDMSVEGSPAQLVARFSQDLDPSRTQLEVRDASGARIARGGEPGSSKRHFVLLLPELAPGDYEVRWTSFSSEDGELGRGSYTFTVMAGPTPGPSLTPPATASASASPSPTQVPPATQAVDESPTAVAQGLPDSEASTGSTGAGSVLIPIVAALIIVVLFAGWLLRGRKA